MKVLSRALDQVQLATESGKLTLESQNGAFDSGSWMVRALNEDAYLIRRNLESHAGEVCHTSVALLYHTLLTLISQEFTGVVRVDTSAAQKKIFLVAGNLSFASSDLIDDRLGEVVYREGILSLDQWTVAAAKVTREKKFGQILLEADTFSHYDLWNSLCWQVRQILCSVFMEDSVFYEIEQGVESASQLNFLEGSAAVIEQCYSYGELVKAFCHRLKESAVIIPLVLANHVKDKTPGSFFSDLLELVGEKTTVKEFVARSKVLSIYTVAALLELQRRNLVRISGLEAEIEAPSKSSAGCAGLQEKILAYQELHRELSELFKRERQELPVKALKSLVDTASLSVSSALFLDANGSIDQESIVQVTNLCQVDPKKLVRFGSAVRQLSCFLRQVCQDRLSTEAKARFESIFRKLVI
mgnify:CR=1 FL=1